MIIGEAPTPQDVGMGAPMSEGQPAVLYLETVLAEADISMSDMYVTTALKCPKSPQPERDPHMKLAQRACGSFLDAEIESVRPRAVLAMGPSPYYHFTHAAGLMKHRGQAIWDPVRELWVVPTVQPDFVLINPAYSEVFTADVMKFKRLMEGIDEKPNVRIVEVQTLGAFRALAAKLRAHQGIVTYDLETRGFVDFRKAFSKVWCAGFSIGERDPDGAIVSYLVPMEHPDSPFIHDNGPMRDYEVLREVCDTVASIILDGRTNGHNVKFDQRNTINMKRRFESASDEDVAEWCQQLRSRVLWSREERPKRLTPKRSRTDLRAELEALAEQLSGPKPTGIMAA